MVESLHGYFLYHYNPSVAAAGLFAGLFFLTTAAHTWRMFRERTFFCIPFILGGIFELISYGTRCGSHNNTASLIPYIIQSTFSLVAPALFAASIYMVLGRTMKAVGGEGFSMIRRTWLTKLFVTGDIISFFVQAGGAGITVNASNAKLGQNIILAGFLLQIIMFVFFVVIAVVFRARMMAGEKSGASSGDVQWRRILDMLFAASALLLARNIFRVVEYAMGQDGYLLTHEWTLYVFDSVLMFSLMVIYFVSYPSQAKPVPKSEM